jgi:exodeoxyribonuclease V gamma subunit
VVQLGRLEHLLEEWESTCDNVALVEALPLTVVREAWLQALDQGRLNQRFLAGAVNFCTLMPMRAIPFRVVCLLGMNDGDYPRAQPPLDFDLMGGDYRPGDRSRREDDRYLLLEAVLSAREQLYISWVGRSIRDNSERPPSVLVGQLRDHLAAGWQSVEEGEEEDGQLAEDAGARLLDGLTVVHPLQPFSARYFLPSSPDSPLFSYAREWAVLHDGETGGSAMSGPDAGASGAAFSDVSDTAPAGASLWTPPEAIDVAELQQFVRDPLRTFFNQRLKVFFDEADAEAADDEPFALDPLQRYALSDSLLQAGLSAGTFDDAHAALTHRATQLRRSGLLPFSGFGEKQQAALLVPLPDLLTRYREQLARWPVEVASPWPVDSRHEGVRVEGWLGGLRQAASGESQFAVLSAVPNGLMASARSLKWHRLTRLWVTHLAGNASGLPLTSIVVASDVTLTFEPVPPVYAAQVFGELVAGWLAGMAEPMPMALQTAFAWLAHADAGGADDAAEAAGSPHDKALEEARKVYEGTYARSGEMAQNAYLARHFPSADALFADGRFATWAERLYRPLFEAGTAALETAEKAKVPA